MNYEENSKRNSQSLKLFKVSCKYVLKVTVNYITIIKNVILAQHKHLVISVLFCVLKIIVV